MQRLTEVLVPKYLTSREWSERIGRSVLCATRFFFDPGGFGYNSFSCFVLVACHTVVCFFLLGLSTSY